MRKLTIPGVALTALALTAVARNSRGGAAANVRGPPPEPGERGGVRLLAPPPRDPPPLGLVPESRQHPYGPQSADPPLQRRLMNP
jgi:hypothetical protein